MYAILRLASQVGAMTNLTEQVGLALRPQLVHLHFGCTHGNTTTDFRLRSQRGQSKELAARLQRLQKLHSD